MPRQPVSPEMFAGGPRQPREVPALSVAPIPPPSWRLDPDQERRSEEQTDAYWQERFYPRQPETFDVSSPPLSAPLPLGSPTPTSPALSPPLWPQDSPRHSAAGEDFLAPPASVLPSSREFPSVPPLSAPSGHPLFTPGAGSPSGSRELIDAIEDLTDEVRRLRESMEKDRRGSPDQAEEQRQAKDNWLWKVGAAHPSGGAAPSVPKRGGK